MKTKYDVELPKTREELLSEATFEWIKTERTGDVCKFKDLIVENGVEYIVFQDNSRVNSSLIGEVILQHQSDFEVLGGIDSAFEQLRTSSEEEIFSQPERHNTTPLRRDNLIEEPRVVISSLPAISILEKAKKKKRKFILEIQVEVPSAEVISIVRENFEASDDQLFDYFITKVDKKKFVSSIITSISNK